MNCPDHKNRNSCLDLLLPFSDLSRQTQSVGVHQSRSRVLVGQPLQALKISEFGPRRLSPQSVTQFEFPVKVNQYMRAGWLRSFVFTIFISGKPWGSNLSDCAPSSGQVLKICSSMALTIPLWNPPRTIQACWDSFQDHGSVPWQSVIDSLWAALFEFVKEAAMTGIVPRPRPLFPSSILCGPLFPSSILCGQRFSSS